MAANPMKHEDLQKLKGFIEFVSANPTILNTPHLAFVKNFIEQFGGKIPEGEFKIPTGGKCPFGGGKEEPAGKQEATAPEPDSDSDEEEMKTDSESEVELDMEGVIEGDTGTDQPMGDESKTPSEEEIDQASDLRSKAAAAYGQQDFEGAIKLYTQAIEMNPGNALFHAKRGQAFLKLKKPNACIRDCDKALELNCDSAAAYKFRGRAHRLLGNWEEAAKDLRQACKLDFDEETDEWLREVTPNAKKIEQHRIKQERKKAERARKAREAAQNKARAQQKKKTPAPPPGFDGGFPNFGGPGSAGGFDVNELFAGLQDPEIAAAMQDITTNPANVYKYKSNPKFLKLLEAVKMMGGGTGGFPAGFPNMGGAEDGGPTPPPEPTKPAKKPDFTDDGLD